MYTCTSASFVIINVYNSNFVNNSASDQGGVAYTGSSLFTIINSSFANSTASIGGVLYASASSFSIVNINFISNGASTKGGVIFTDNSHSILVSAVSSKITQDTMEEFYM